MTNPVTSPYARTFDPDNKHYSNSEIGNKMFVLAQENYLNDVLRARGHVFLNEIYDALGFERTPVGQLIGWLRDDGDEIDFQLTVLDLKPGEPPLYVLDFNVTQNHIFDRI